jgi:CheY-like chemotaxis protein
VKRVLVVDDEAAMRLLVRVNLPHSGYEVVEAQDAETALEVARTGRFDVFLLDVMMPGMSGFELAAKLRDDPATATIPVVFVSARADRADVEQGLALGAADYITKPFDPLRLGQHLDEVLAGARRTGRSQLLGDVRP